MYILVCHPTRYAFFFFNDPAPTEIYTLPLHDALPISWAPPPAATRGNSTLKLVPPSAERTSMPPPCERTIWCAMNSPRPSPWCWPGRRSPPRNGLNSVGSSSAGMVPPLRTVMDTRSSRSEEHTSELQSQSNLVCRLLLEKKKKEMKIRLCNLIV